MKLLPLLLLFLPSCKLLSSFDHVEPRDHILTPKGAMVMTPLPAWREGQTDAQVLGWVDARIDEWIEHHPERTPAELMELAHKYYFKLVDHFRFPSAASETGFAEGQIFYGTTMSNSSILASLYTKSENKEPPVSPPYPWMLEFRDGLWKWGVMPTDGKGFAVIPHELDHALMGSFH